MLNCGETFRTMQPTVVPNFDRIIPDLYDAAITSAFMCSGSKPPEARQEASAQPFNLGTTLLRLIGFPAEPNISVSRDLEHQLRQQGQEHFLLTKESSKVPVWEREPAPMKGWSKEDQSAMIRATKDAKLKYGKKSHIFRREMAKIARQFPHKTLQDCEDCFRHIESSRIAYFGRKDSKDSN
jgi:hypothetical protein